MPPGVGSVHDLMNGLEGRIWAVFWRADEDAGLAVEGLWKARTAWLPLFKRMAYLTAIRKGRQLPYAHLDRGRSFRLRGCYTIGVL